MPEPITNRRLAAILAADVVGYSKLMGADEMGTIEALRKHRENLFDPAVTQHNGRVFKLMGDGTLVEFASVVDAVKCAMAIQRAVAAEKLPEGAPKITLRIGINLGDVILDGEDVYGDGVNVAARLEPLSEHGGICVSSIVNESVSGRVEVAFRDGGEVSVKNIERPLRIWKWKPDDASSTPETVAPADPAGPDTAGPLCSIAVLPFDNMSGDPEQEYFSDGISEDIITDLSKIGELTVIARNSSFAYKGRSVDLRQVGRELGVSNILEGSIRRAGNRVRINAQLIDATDGSHVWAERFDRDLTDIFEVQDEVTRHIVAALEIALSPEEERRIQEVGTKVPEAHDLYLRGREIMGVNSLEVFRQKEGLLEQALTLDPGFAPARAAMALNLSLDHLNDWSPESANALSRAVLQAEQAYRQAPEDSYVLYAYSIVKSISGDVDVARLAIEKAIELDPNFAAAYNSRGVFEIFAGRPANGLPDIEKGIQLDPANHQQSLHFLGMAHLLLGHFETAIAAFRERIVQVPDTDISRSMLASALGHLGEIEEAKAVWAELKALHPDYSLRRHLSKLAFTDPAVPEHFREGFRKAGLPLE